MKKKKTKSGVDISSTLGMKLTHEPTAWLVVANGGGAKIFEFKEKELKQIRDFPYPEGKIKGSDQVSDRPGRSFESWSGARGGHQGSGPRHSMTSQESPTDHALKSLCKTIAGWLESARKENQFEKLILVAEPRLMGRLKSNLSNPTTRLITLEKEKDYCWLTKPELESRLHSLLPGKAVAKERRLPAPQGAFRIPKSM